MPDPTDILRFRRFWRFYVRLDEVPLDNEMLDLFGTTTISGTPYAEAVISLRCSQDCFLDLTITPDLATVNLGLRNLRKGCSGEMGWWDDARWHPYALRWLELERLHQYWLDEAIDAVNPSAAFLLLAPFVGLGADERGQLSARKDVLVGHYQHLDLFSPSEAAELSDRTLVLPSEDDYTWSQDAELGWVFGGEYPCYSIRNRAHYGGSEGRFPFTEWSTVVAQLPPAGSAT
jgi:hypothetical protein